MRPLTAFLFLLTWMDFMGGSEAAFGGFACRNSKNRSCALVSPSNRFLQSSRSLPKKSERQSCMELRETSEDGMDGKEIKIVTEGWEGEEISDEMWENIETGEPPKFMVIKQMLGINGFTYILAGLIVFFLSANSIYGPGWLGQAFGMKGAGTFTQMSDSLPDTVDLNDADFLL